MSRNINLRVKCPFFQEESSCGHFSAQMAAARKRMNSRRIRCEGVTPNSVLRHEFMSKQDRDNFAEDFCYSDCWRACPVAIMLWEQREFENEIEEKNKNGGYNQQ